MVPYWLVAFMLAIPLPAEEWRLEEAFLEERHQRRVLYDGQLARAYLEKVRWPDGPKCTHCGTVGGHYRLHGKGHRPGLYKCRGCRGQFSVTLGTVFQQSKVGLDVWLRALHLLYCSQDISIRDLHKALGVSYRTAWLMSHRIRETLSAIPRPPGNKS